MINKEITSIAEKYLKALIEQLGKEIEETHVKSAICDMKNIKTWCKEQIFQELE